MNEDEKERVKIEIKQINYEMKTGNKSKSKTNWRVEGSYFLPVMMFDKIIYQMKIFLSLLAELPNPAGDQFTEITITFLSSSTFLLFTSNAT